MEKDTEQKIKKLQLFEQNLQSIAMQKQQFQNQLTETESALEELNTSEESYKIIGNIMVKADKESLKVDLNTKKEMYALRVKTLEKQENTIKEKSKEIQKEVMGNMNEDDTRKGDAAK